ncbi:MAG: UDP-2,4-diacetamido-2,4,6-trideoxy-beta-L-altropyranose hydrolase [Enterobacterales bacterium]|jgi:UDP-2,4-diacetamido-2,4,6-trideoxy-beta-L-altropyranose hydrolase
MTSVNIIPDSSPSQGLGHVSRCMSLAKVLKERGFEINFTVSSYKALKHIHKKGYDASIGSNATDIYYDITIVDSYTYPESYYIEQKKKQNCLIVIDDLADRKLTSDIYINHNLFANNLDLKNIISNHFLLGFEYALVDRSFYDITKIKKSSNCISISYGGTDNGQFSVPVIESLRKLKIENPINLILSDLNKIKPEKLKYIRDNYIVNISSEVEMSDILADTFIFLCAAGQTSLEALISNTAFVAFLMADNQIPNAKALKDLNFPVVNQFDPYIIAKKTKDIVNNNSPNQFDFFYNKNVVIGPDNIVNRIVDYIK